jgi:hypothetical protein
MSKNNPENRGLTTELRTYNGKKVKPVLYVNGNRRYMAGVYDGTDDLVIAKGEKDPIPYASLQAA